MAQWNFRSWVLRYNRGFTLIEVVISIALIGLIFYYMYGVIDNAMYSSNILQSDFKKSTKKENNLQILQDDLLNATDLNITNNNTFSILGITTHNTLHNIHKPYVFWFVSKEQNALIRLESSDRFQIPLGYTMTNKPYLDLIAKDVKRFLITQSKSKKFILIDLKIAEDFYFFELFKPMGRLQ